jgi:hypothetical protein
MPRAPKPTDAAPGDPQAPRTRRSGCVRLWSPPFENEVSNLIFARELDPVFMLPDPNLPIHPPGIRVTARAPSRDRVSSPKASPSARGKPWRRRGGTKSAEMSRQALSAVRALSLAVERREGGASKVPDPRVPPPENEIAARDLDATVLFRPGFRPIACLESRVPLQELFAFHWLELERDVRPFCEKRLEEGNAIRPPVPPSTCRGNLRAVLKQIRQCVDVVLRKGSIPIGGPRGGI